MQPNLDPCQHARADARDRWNAAITPGRSFVSTRAHTGNFPRRHHRAPTAALRHGQPALAPEANRQAAFRCGRDCAEKPTVDPAPGRLFVYAPEFLPERFPSAHGASSRGGVRVSGARNEARAAENRQDLDRETGTGTPVEPKYAGSDAAKSPSPRTRYARCQADAVCSEGALRR